MVFRSIKNSRLGIKKPNPHHQEDLIDGLLKSRQLHCNQTIEYEDSLVRSLDLDPTNNFLLVGASTGLIELQGVQDSNTGLLEYVDNFSIRGRHFLRRVQWLPDLQEQLFSVISTGRLLVVNPSTMSKIEQYKFKNDLLWSDWNPIDLNIIAVSGTDSTVSLVDLRAGNSLQTIIIHSPSNLRKHTANRCCWSKLDSRLLVIGDNDGLVHMYDIRNNMKPLLRSSGELGEINCMSFTHDENSLITTHGNRNVVVKWGVEDNQLRRFKNAFGENPNANNKTTEIGSLHSRRDSVGSEQISPLLRFIRSRRRRGIGGDEFRSGANRFKTFLGSQFHLTARHLYVPAHEVPSNDYNDLNIFDLKTGYRMKSLKTDPSFVQGAFSVTGLMPDSMVLYTGGMDKLRVWSFNEMSSLREGRISSQFHSSDWSSESDDYD